MAVNFRVNGTTIAVSPNYSASDVLEFLRDAAETDPSQWIDLIGPNNGTVLLRPSDIYSVEVSDDESVGVL